MLEPRWNFGAETFGDVHDEKHGTEEYRYDTCDRYADIDLILEQPSAPQPARLGRQRLQPADVLPAASEQDADARNHEGHRDHRRQVVVRHHAFAFSGVMFRNLFTLRDLVSSADCRNHDATPVPWVEAYGS